MFGSLSQKQYDGQVNSYLEQMSARLEDYKIASNCALQNFLLNFPEEVLDMPYEDFVECGGTIEDADDFLNQPNDSASKNKDVLKSAKKKRPKKVLAAISESDDTDPDLSSGKKTTRKKKGQSKKMINMPPPLTERYARFHTPAHLQQPAHLVKDTPLVTPAFNPRLPATPAAAKSHLSIAPNGKRTTVTSFQGKANNKNLVSVTMDTEADNFSDAEIDDLENFDQGMIADMKSMYQMLKFMFAKSGK